MIHTESPSEFYVQYSDRSEQDLKEYNASIKEYCTSNKIEAKMERGQLMETYLANHFVLL